MKKRALLMILGLLSLIFGTYMNTPMVSAAASARLTVVAGSNNGYVYVYDGAGNLLWNYNTGADVASVAVSSDGAYIAVGSLGNKLYLFSVSGVKLWEKSVLIASGGMGWGGSETKSVAISADGEYIVAGCTDNLYVYKNDGTLHWSHSGGESCVGISPAASYVVACNRYDGTIDFFSISSNTPVWTKSIGAQWVATSNPGYVIASSSGTAFMFNNLGGQLWSYALDRGGYVRVDMPEDGLAAVAVNDDPGDVACYIWYFNLAGLVWKYTPCPPQHDFYSVSISTDGNIISMGPGNIGGIYIYRRDGSALQTMPQSSWVQSVDLTSDGQFGVWGDNTYGTVWLFSEDSNIPLWSKTIGGNVHAVALAYCNMIDVTFGSTPTIDGSISAEEYADAHSVTFATSGGTCTVYFKHNGNTLYVAFDVPNVDVDSAVQIFVDTLNDRATLPQTDDYRLTISLRSPPDDYGENQGTGTDWTPWSAPVGWTGAHQVFSSTWNAEFAIPFAKLGITSGVAKTIGISFWNAWTSTGDYRWLTDSNWLDPSTWGGAFSSDKWIVKYTLTIKTPKGGTTSPAPGKYLHPSGTVVSVTALPESGYTLYHWELDGSYVKPTNPISVTMNTNHILKAFFLNEAWPMHGRDPACTSYSSSDAPDANATLWVSNLPGGTAWAYPLVAEGKVFIGAGGYLNAFNENDGDFLWSFRASAQPGYPATSAVADGRVFFGTAEPGPGGCIYALDATTGEQVWNFTTEGYVRAPPVVSEDRLYIGGDLDGTGKIYCINATNGASIWNYTTQDRMTSIAVAYGKVYASCGHWETETLAAVYCLDMYDGSYIWSFDTGKDIAGYLAVANGRVYFTACYEGSDCVVYALDATDGDEIWSTTRYSNGNGGGVAVAYGKVFIALGYYLEGIYALNETNGDEIWAFPMENAPGGGPVVADGKVFFSGGYPSHMFYAVNETNGAVVWSYQLVGDVHSSSSAIADGRVFVADHWDAKLYAFWSYKATIKAYCNTESSDVSVSITMDGSPTGYNTPHTFFMTAPHTYTVPDNDPSGHKFKQWSTGSTSTTITVNSGGTYTAYYQTQYTLTITALWYGTTSPAPGTYTYWSGTAASVAALPSYGYRLDHWELDGSNVGSANPISVTMNANHALDAFFTPTSPVGGVVVPIDKLGLLAPCVGLASTIVVAAVALAIYVKRVKQKKEKQ